MVSRYVLVITELKVHFKKQIKVTHQNIKFTAAITFWYIFHWGQIFNLHLFYRKSKKATGLEGGISIETERHIGKQQNTCP